MKNLKTLVIFIGASFMLLVGILLCINEKKIINMNYKIEKIERYTYNKESIVFLGSSPMCSSLSSMPTPMPWSSTHP